MAIEFPNDADIAQLAPDLSRIALVVLDFPKWTDGRAYSQARLLRAALPLSPSGRHPRQRLQSAGGHGLLQLLHRTGFSEVSPKVIRGEATTARKPRFFGHLCGGRALAFFPRRPRATKATCTRTSVAGVGGYRTRMSKGTRCLPWASFVLGEKRLLK